MSQVEKIAAGLSTLEVGVQRAQTDAAAANNMAQQIASRAGAAGFAGIAAGMAQVRESINNVRGRMNAVSGSIGEAKAGLAAVPPEPSPEQAVAMLTPLAQKTGTVREQVAGAIEKVNQTQQLAERVLRGGQPGPMLAALNGLKQTLIQVAQQAGAIKQQLEAAVAEARQVGAQGN